MSTNTPGQEISRSEFERIKRGAIEHWRYELPDHFSSCSDSIDEFMRKSVGAKIIFYSTYKAEKWGGSNGWNAIRNGEVVASYIEWFE